MSAQSTTTTTNEFDGEQTAIITAATASTAHERRSVIEALRYSPFAQMIGQSWQGARILIRVHGDEDLERVVSGIRSRIEAVSGIRYNRYA